MWTEQTLLNRAVGVESWCQVRQTPRSSGCQALGQLSLAGNTQSKDKGQSDQQTLKLEQSVTK